MARDGGVEGVEVGGSPPAADPLDEVFRRPVGIHASLAESLSTDPKVMPWAEREPDDVLRYIQTALHPDGEEGRNPNSPERVVGSNSTGLTNRQRGQT